MMHATRISAILVLIFGLPAIAAPPGALSLLNAIHSLEARFDTELNGWRVYQGDVPEAAQVTFDDRAWDTADVGYRWEEPDSICWFRRWYTVPETLGGLPTKGARLTLRLNIDNGGAIYVNGEVKQANFDRDKGVAVLTESARPGDRYLIAVRAINRPGWGSLMGADMHNRAATAVRKPTAAFLETLRYALEIQRTGASREAWLAGLDATWNAVDQKALDSGDTETYLASLAKAEEIFHDRAVVVLQRDTETRLAAVAQDMAMLSEKLAEAKQKHIDLPYQRSTLTVAREFSAFAREDLENEDLRIVHRGLWNADWIANAVREALRECDTLLTNPPPPVPRYTTGPVTIRDGAFWQGDQPVFFVGMGHFGQVRKDIPIFQDYGYSIAQITISVGSVLKSETEINEEPINAVIEVLDKAAANNVALDLLLEPHGWPNWAKEKHPELNVDTHNFLRYKVDHPNAGIIYERYLKALIPRIKDHPGLFSYCLYNEPSYNDASPWSHEKFQRWLQTKHGDIATLNRRHAAQYTAFDQVPLPEGIGSAAFRGEKPALAAAQSASTQQALLYDWHCFNKERFNEVHRAVIDKVHALDPDTPVHSKTMGRLFDTYLEFSSGVDHEDWAVATDISGNDNWFYYRSWADHDPAISGDYAANWWRQSMYYGFQRSIAPDQPIFNSENHSIEDDTPLWVAERHIRTVHWMGAIHGEGASTTWVWERGDGQTLGDCIITRANCAHALGEVGLDLMRCAREVVALQQVQPDIALLVAPSAIPFSESYLAAMRTTFEGLHFLGAPVGFVTEKEAAQGKLHAYKAVIVPNAKRVPEALVQQLGDYAAQGGTLVVAGECFTEDEYGQTQAALDYLHETATSRYGAGQVIYSPTLPDREAWQRLGNALLQDLEVARPIRVTDEKGQIINGVEYRSTAYKNGYLLTIVNYRKQELPVRLIAPGQIEAVTDLIRNVPAKDFFELAPLEPQLLYIETDVVSG